MWLQHFGSARGSDRILQTGSHQSGQVSNSHAENPLCSLTSVDVVALQVNFSPDQQSHEAAEQFSRTEVCVLQGAVLYCKESTDCPRTQTY